MISQFHGGKSIDYFGMPAPLHIPNSSKNEVRQAANMLSDYLHKKHLKILLRDPSVAFQLSMTASGKNIHRLEELFFRNSSSVNVEFMRVLETSSRDRDATFRLTKSVKLALKTSQIVGLDIQVIDNQSSPGSISSGMSILQTLHRASAGKMTRNQESWNEQKECIGRGHAFLVIGILAGEAMGASYFLLSGPAAYYGVSANNVEHKELSLSHVLVSEAFSYLARKNFERLFIGTQFSDKVREINSKEKAIENFKSLFGGRLQYSLLASRFSS